MNLKKKISAFLLISIILLHFTPFNDIFADPLDPLNENRLKTNDTQFVPPKDKDVVFSDSPYIFFSIDYELPLIYMNIEIDNNLNAPISLFNLWIQINKSDIIESIRLTQTKIIDSKNKLSLSTFDIDASDDQFGNGSMIFHIKLYEGEIISPNEKFDIVLSWRDSDHIIAQYDPNLIFNDRSDDIQVFIQSSTKTEGFQPFPLIERCYYQEKSEELLIFAVDFKLTNLMESNLDTFDFSFIKIKDFQFPTNFYDFYVESPFLDSTEISDIALDYEETNEKINYSLAFGDIIKLESNESLMIKTKWVARRSTIEDDYVIWNMGKQDSFNAGVPFYLIGLPFYPILSPAEPIILNDYDLDGLTNKFEKIHGFDPMLQDTWLSWRSLRSDYTLNKIYANDLDLEGKILISIPERFSQVPLIMKVESLGSNDKLRKVSIDDQIIFNEISAPEDYILSYREGKRTILIKFILSHYGTAEDSQFKITFLINRQEIPDLSSYFEPDSDSDGLYDLFEDKDFNFVPDSDNDGIFDGLDFLPNTALNYPANGLYQLNFPIKDSNGDSEIAVNLQIKPTINDFTGTEPYRGNELLIIPGVRIYGENQGGDYLPDCAFSTDDGATGIVYLLPMKRQISNEYYSWAGTFNYKHDNLAKEFRQIKLKFSLVWLLIEQDPISGETNLFHLYENPDPFMVQGISITESEPKTVMVGLVEDGKDYRKTIQNAELLAHLTYSNLNYDPSDMPNLQIRSNIIEDIENLNETRDSLREQLLNNLVYENTNFIYITSSFSATYNLEMLYNVFEEQNPLRTYEPEEIDNYYLLEQNAFTGILATQVLKGSRVEFIDQFAFGYKIENVMKSFNLQFSKSKYAGSSCDEIYTFDGHFESNITIIHYFDYGTSVEIETFNSGGWYQYYGDLKVIRIELIGPDIPDIEKDIGVFNVVHDGIGAFLDYFIIDYLSGFLDAVEVFTVFVQLFNQVNTLGKFGAFMTSTPVGAVGNVLGVLNFIFGGMQLMAGISLYMQGAYRTGLTEGIRGGLQIATGVLMLFPDPTGITKALAIGLMVFQFFDWVADTFFNFNFWDWFLGTILGIPNVDPDYKITSSSIGYSNKAKIKRQAGVRVGDSMSISVSFKNEGNTDITLGLKIQAGSGSYGSFSDATRGPGSPGTVSCSDSFEQPSPITTLRVYSEVSWFYGGWCKLRVVPWPPFIWLVCVPDSSGGPESDTSYYSFDMPVLPATIGAFVNLIESGTWFPPTFLTTEKTPIITEITPATPDPYLHYELTLRNYYLFPRSFIISAPVDNLWNYDIIYDGVSRGDSFEFRMYFLNVKKFEIVVTPTSENRLNPGDHYFLIRVQQEENSLNRKDIKLDYTIAPIIDFQVTFDPLIPAPENLDYGLYIYHYINVTNIGNIFDNYYVEVIGLDSDLYTLYKPDLTTAATEMDTSLIVFQIPYWKIVSVGDNPYTIRVSSVTDPIVVKDYNFILHIDEYHKMSFTVDEPILSLTDSDLYVYNFTLINLGNVVEHFTITYDEVPFATSSLETNQVTLNSGETEVFSLTLTPFELGNATFYIRAFSDYLFEEIELTINVTDDDILPPYFENFFINDNHNWLNISFIAIDELLGDDLGLSNINIYVDGALVHNYQPTPSDTIFNFSLTNEWIWTEGLHDIRVDITDADDDRNSDDSLTTTIYGTFEVTLDEMYKYVMWLCEEMNNYIYDNAITALYGVVSQKLVKIQGLLWDAYQLIENGQLHTGLVRNKMAEIKLEIAETKTELMINKQSMSQEHFEHLKDSIRNIRNKIVELMGLSVGEFSHEISLVAVDIYNLRDFVEDNINATGSENLENAITLAAEKLENAIFDISLDKDTESSLTAAQHALDNAEAEVIALQRKGKISVELADNLFVKIWNLQWQVELLKGEI